EMGSVDAGSAHTDLLPVERRRGISVKATCTSFTWKGTGVNLVDTPGHVDFSSEIERSLWAMDSAVLVLSGMEGVQPQTELLFQALCRQHLPVILFINKMDREGADAERTLSQVRRRLSQGAFFLQNTSGHPAPDDALLDALSQVDDEILEMYMEGEVPEGDFLRSRLRMHVAAGRLFPVLTGSALRGRGVEELLDAMVDLLPPPESLPDLSGIVFGSLQDRVLGRGVLVRLFGGMLTNRSAVTLPAPSQLPGETQVVDKKISQIRSLDGEDLGLMRAGEIAVVFGLPDARIGQVLGQAPEHRAVESGDLRQPIYTMQVVPDRAEDLNALRSACEKMTLEDPLLQARYLAQSGEMHLSMMGPIQGEIVLEDLRETYGIPATLRHPTVIYRETIARETAGFVAYTMPKPCWAVLKFILKPGARGSGITYRSLVPHRTIQERYQHQVQQALPTALRQGRLGWQVTDLDITLVDGSDHQFHTHPLDFIVATPMAIQDGLQRGGSVLLEPILLCRFFVPAESVGRIMSDISTMRGSVTDTETDDDRVILTALVPAATSMNYPNDLASITSGRGSMSIRLHGYEPCPAFPDGQLPTMPRMSVDPLDQAKYILAARSALASSIYDS
ncbi:MAG: TetM/TetW/TetO/TetS family tetracycline resistance ribosomal protection protein, partial [Clostridia bacterium]|nr:TetM/TetW/TetO/TetS family tetracycline resistance ribosomal protection protein [Clostridia bacterium]